SGAGGGAAALAPLPAGVLGPPLAGVLASLCGAAGPAGVLFSRFVNIGASGPSPAMYEPLWYTEKTLSMVAEVVAAVAAAVLVLTHRSREREPPPVGEAPTAREVRPGRPRHTGQGRGAPAGPRRLLTTARARPTARTRPQIVPEGAGPVKGW